jgi:D-3-phosphoglycerate dehydrogenase / 2-oxoglutarate reductase
MTSPQHPTGLRRVLVTPRSLTARDLDEIPELEPLRAAGYSLVAGPEGRVPTEQELLALVPDVVGWVAGVETVSAAVLARANALRAISRNGTGIDGIDTAAAAAAGVLVLRAPAANAQGVAELALALGLSALRGIPWSARSVRSGGWEREQGRELGETRVGVLGLGAIGFRVARMFQALGAPVQGFDPFAAPAEVPVVPLDELVAGSDLLTLHAPPAADGRPLLSRERLATVPRRAVLVNTARSSLVDESAVLSLLDSGHLAAYMVDSFTTEPPEPGPLLMHPRVVPTPHIGGYTGGSVRRATGAAVANLLDALKEPE